MTFSTDAADAILANATVRADTSPREKRMVGRGKRMGRGEEREEKAGEVVGGEENRAAVGPF